MAATVEAMAATVEGTVAAVVAVFTIDTPPTPPLHARARLFPHWDHDSHS